MPKHTIAALQIGSDPAGTAATLRNILAFEPDIQASGAKLVVLPEALLGGYPKGEDFGTRVGFRTPEGRVRFAQYHRNAVTLDGPELRAIAQLSTRTDAALVLGLVERAATQLFCTAAFFLPGEGLVAHHRKLVPTGTERLLWSRGDGSTLPVVESPAGRLGAALCWENHMPLFRTAMYSKGVEIWCAPTVDDRPLWQASMRHIAHEGRCFLVSACQVQPSPRTLGLDLPHWDPDRPLIAGGSLIVSPFGDLLAGPLDHTTGLLTAEIDLDDLTGARLDLDTVGHYARPDIFRLEVDERPQPTVLTRT